MKLQIAFLSLALALTAAGAALALTSTLPATVGGHDERVDGIDPCPQEMAFLLGAASAEISLQVGGNAWGCDSEWAAAFRFDLSGFAAGQPIDSATLIVRKTGYADDSSGFPYVGAFAFEPAAVPVEVLRDDLTPMTALDVLMPGAPNVDLSFTVTSAVQNFLDDGAPEAGLLLCGIYSEAGYHDFIYVGNVGHTYPPRLVIEYTENTVATADRSFDAVKSLYR